MTTNLPLVVMGSGTSWDGLPRPDKMLSQELVRHARVLFVDPPVSVATPTRFRDGASRRLTPQLSEPADRVVRLATVAPPLQTRPGIRGSVPPLARAQIRWALRQLGQQPYAVFDCKLGRLTGGWGPAARNVLYGTDDYVAGAALMGRNITTLERDEAATLRRADTVIAISEPLAERWRGMGATVSVVPNGVSTDTYAKVDLVEPAAGVDLPPPVAGVLGHLADRIDLGLLEAVVAAGISLLLVGPRALDWQPQRFQRLLASPQVRWIDQQPFEAVPSYLRWIDVGITPYVDSEFNRASFPLKTLEYLAAGRPVVSTDLPATRWLNTDLVRVARDPDSFVAAVREAAVEAHVPSLADDRRAFATTHSWRSRATEIASLIGLSDEQEATST